MASKAAQKQLKELSGKLAEAAHWAANGFPHSALDTLQGVEWSLELLTEAHKWPSEHITRRNAVVQCGEYTVMNNDPIRRSK